MEKNEIIALFKSKKFRATPQRIAVFSYVLNNPTHPDVLEIYDNVLKENPNFSKTTVYNALNALTENGFLREVSIDGERVRYDAKTCTHGHFRCQKCGKIFDFEASEINFEMPQGFLIEKKDVFYSGLCPECNENAQSLPLKR